MSVFELWKLSYDGIFVNTHTLRDPRSEHFSDPTTTFDKPNFLFLKKYFGIGPTATFELLSFKNRSHIFKFLKLKNIYELGVKPSFGDVWGLLSDRKLVIK